MSLDLKRIAEVTGVPEDLLGDPRAIREYHRAIEHFGRTVAYVAQTFTRMLEDSLGLGEILRIARVKARRERRTKRYNAKMSARSRRR